MREYLTLHRGVFPSYLTIGSGRISFITPLDPLFWRISDSWLDLKSILSSSFHPIWNVHWHCILLDSPNSVALFTSTCNIVSCNHDCCLCHRSSYFDKSVDIGIPLKDESCLGREDCQHSVYGDWLCFGNRCMSLDV